jgi:recombination associated protein RdgC
MWFKNLVIYRFNVPVNADDIAKLAERMAAFKFTPCESNQLASMGWVPPLGNNGTDLVHAASGNVMICARKQQKILPAGAVNELLEERVIKIEERDGRKLSKKERRDLKDQISYELLPKALTRSTLLFAYISPKDGMLVVNSSTHKIAEELLALLRETLGSLPVVPLATKKVPYCSMTDWLIGITPAGFTVGGDCELRDALEEGGSAILKNQGLHSDAVFCLAKEMLVRKLALSWSDRIECVVDDALVIRKLRFSDIVQEKAEDPAAQFDTDFSIMALELSEFIKALVDALGGKAGIPFVRV